MPAAWRDLLCDPQTSGGLLLAVRDDAQNAVLAIAERHGMQLNVIGELCQPQAGQPMIEVR